MVRPFLMRTAALLFFCVQLWTGGQKRLEHARGQDQGKAAWPLQTLAKGCQEEARTDRTSLQQIDESWPSRLTLFPRPVPACMCSQVARPVWFRPQPVTPPCSRRHAPVWRRAPLRPAHELKPWTRGQNKMFCVEAGYFPCSLSLHSAQVGMFTSMRLMHCIRLKTGWTSLRGLSSSHADQEPQCLHACRTCWHCQCTTENYLQECAQVEGTHLQDVHVFTLTVRLRFLPSLCITFTRPCANLPSTSQGEASGLHCPCQSTLQETQREQRGAHPEDCISVLPVL